LDFEFNLIVGFLILDWFCVDFLLKEISGVLGIGTLDPFVKFEFNLVVGVLILDWFCGEFDFRYWN